MFRRFARLAVTVIVPAAMIIAATGLAVADDPSGSESPPSEAPEVAPARLTLRPMCTADRLHRFAVDHLAGPPTQFAVRVGGETAGGELQIAAGATRYFWVTAAQPGATEITWPDGTASASQTDQPCAEADPPADPVAEVPEPSPPSSNDPRAAVATPEPRGDPTRGSPAPAAAPPASDAAPEAAGRPPRPTARGTTFACPDGWIAVDSDGDSKTSEADDCEPVIGAPAAAQRSPVSWPGVALVVTLALLIFAIGLGATTRRGSV